MLKGYFTYTRFFSARKKDARPDALLFTSKQPITASERYDIGKSMLVQDLIAYPEALIILDWITPEMENRVLFTRNTFYVPPFIDKYRTYGLTMWKRSEMGTLLPIHYEYGQLLNGCKEIYRLKEEKCKGCPKQGKQCVIDKFELESNTATYPFPFISAEISHAGPRKDLYLSTNYEFLQRYQETVQFKIADMNAVETLLRGGTSNFFGFYFVDPLDSEPNKLYKFTIPRMRGPKYHSFTKKLEALQGFNTRSVHSDPCDPYDMGFAGC